MLSGAHALDDGLDEVPYRRLQPFVVEDAHIEGLMPVFQGDIPDAGVVFHTFVGDKSDADAGGHQIQGGSGGIHGADDGFIGRATK